MDATVVNILVGLIGISAVCTVLVQLGKNLIPSREDAEGNETGPRRWLAPAIIVVGTILGIAVGLIRKDYTMENGMMFMAAWAIAGFLVGATSVGMYSGLKSIIPGVFSSSGWVGGGGN